MGTCHTTMEISMGTTYALKEKNRKEIVDLVFLTLELSHNTEVI